MPAKVEEMMFVRVEEGGEVSDGVERFRVTR